MNNETDKIIEVINQLRPFLNSEGGDIEFIKYEGHVQFFIYLRNPYFYEEAGYESS